MKDLLGGALHRNPGELVVFIPTIQTGGGFAIGHIVVAVANRGNASGGAHGHLPAADHGGDAGVAADSRLTIVAADTLKHAMLTDGIFAVHLILLGLGHSGVMGILVRVCVALTYLDLPLLGGLAAVDHIHGAALTPGLLRPIGVKNDVAGVPVVLDILGTVAGGAGPGVQGIGGAEDLILLIVRAQATLIGKTAKHRITSLVFRIIWLIKILRVINLKDIVVVIITALPVVIVAIYAVGHEEIHLAIVATRHGGESDAINTGAAELMARFLLVGRKAICFVIHLVIQRIPEVEGGLFQKNAIHAGVHLFYIHPHLGDGVLIKGGDKELGARLFVLQRTIDPAVIVGQTAQVGPSRGAKASLAEAADRADNFPCLHINLSKSTGIGEIHILHFVIHADALQMGVSAT